MWLKKHKNWKPHTDSFWQKSSLQYKKCFKSFLQASWSILIQMVWTYKKVQQHYQLQKRCRKHANYSECKNIFFYYMLVKVFQSFTLRILTSMQAARSSRGCQHTPTLIKFLAFRQGRNLFEKLSVFCLKLFHSLLVSPLHTVHLCPQVWLLVLKICFQFSQLLIFFQNCLISLLQKTFQWHHFFFQLTYEDKVVSTSTVHWLIYRTTISIRWLGFHFGFFLWSFILNSCRGFMALFPQSLILLWTQTTDFVMAPTVTVVVVVVTMMVLQMMLIFFSKRGGGGIRMGGP